MTMARGDDVDSMASLGVGGRSHSTHSDSHSPSPGSRTHSRSVSRTSDKEEQNFYQHARSESQVGLREDTDADVRIHDSDARPVELEYETPNTVKGIWLGTYFFFSLLLTLYNKLILGSVCLFIFMFVFVQRESAKNDIQRDMHLGADLELEIWRT